MNSTKEQIQNSLVDYLLNNHIGTFDKDTFPLDDSLFELEILDSVGIVEFIEFVESEWDVMIEDSEISPEYIGTVKKLTDLILDKRNS